MSNLDEKNFENIQLSTIQKSYLIGSLEYGDLGGVDCQGYIEVELGEIGYSELESSWKKIVKRHSILRSSLIKGKISIPVNIDDIKVKIEVIDITDMSSDNRKKQINEIRDYMENINYKKLNVPYVAKAIIIEKTLTFVLSINMLFVDFESVQIILNELQALLLNEKSLDTQNDVGLLLEKQKQSEKLKKAEDINYWNSKGLENINMYDSSEWKVKNTKNTTKKYNRLSCIIEAEIVDNLKMFCGNMGISFSSLFVAIYSLILHVWGKRTLNMINIPISTRHMFSDEYRYLVTEFTDIILLRTKFEKETSLKEYLESVFFEIVDAMDHCTYSGVDHLRNINKNKNESIAAPFVFTGVLNSKGAFKINYGSSKTPQVLIDCQAIEEAEGNIVLSWDYNTCFSTKYFVEKYFEKFQLLLLFIGQKTEIGEMKLTKLQKFINVENSYSDELIIELENNVLEANDYIVNIIERIDSEVTNKLLSNEIKSVDVNHFNVLLKNSILNQIMENFKSEGLFINDTESFESICKKIRVIEQNKTILRNILNSLTDSMFLIKKKNLFIDNKKKSEYDLSEFLKNEEFNRLAINTTIEYIQQHTNNFCSILSGDINPLSILFPNGKSHIAKLFYSGNIIYDYLNTMVANFVKEYIIEREFAEILEVGGGTGVTTEYIFNQISDILRSKYRYTFTDVSKYFTNSMTIEGVSKDVLDLDKPIAGKYKKYDVIIAVGVLNNVININYSIKELYNILSDDGVMIIVEPVGEHIEISVSQAFLMPEHTDIRRENKQYFLNENEWKKVFTDNKFSLIDIKPSNNSWFYPFNQRLFIIKKSTAESIGV